MLVCRQPNVLVRLNNTLWNLDAVEHWISEVIGQPHKKVNLITSNIRLSDSGMAAQIGSRSLTNLAFEVPINTPTEPWVKVSPTEELRS